MALEPNWFPAYVAYDTNTGQALKNAQASVYAPTDITFSTPLPLKDYQGVPITFLVSSDDGIFPPFIVNSATEYEQVIAKSGSFVTPLVSFVGGRGPAGAAGPPGAGIPPTTEASVGDVVKWDGAVTYWAPDDGGGTSSIVGAPAVWPLTFPSSPHTHSAAQISDATSVGQAVIKASSAQEARVAIGAGTGNGTSNLTLGNTATTAMPGNRSFSASEITATPTGPLTATDMQGMLGQIATGLAAGGSGGTGGVYVWRYASGAYPPLPATKPPGVEVVQAYGPVMPTNLPSWVGTAPSQALGKYDYTPLA